MLCRTYQCRGEEQCATVQAKRFGDKNKKKGEFAGCSLSAQITRQPTTHPTSQPGSYSLQKSPAITRSPSSPSQVARNVAYKKKRKKKKKMGCTRCCQGGGGVVPRDLLLIRPVPFCEIRDPNLFGMVKKWDRDRQHG
jgi:hypothetical protein